MTKIKKGDVVRQVLPAPIEGVVERFEANPDTGEMQVLVVWPDTDGDGVPQSRFFKLEDVEPV